MRSNLDKEVKISQLYLVWSDEFITNNEVNKGLVLRETEYITPSVKHLVLLKRVAYPLEYLHDPSRSWLDLVKTSLHNLTK
jgi:hypothetical protein